VAGQRPLSRQDNGILILIWIITEQVIVCTAGSVAMNFFCGMPT
jgi:hypothetical protein